MIEQQIKEARRLEQEFKGSVEDDKAQEVVPLSLWTVLGVWLLMWVLVCGCGGPHAVTASPSRAQAGYISSCGSVLIVWADSIFFISLRCCDICWLLIIHRPPLDHPHGG